MESLISLKDVIFLMGSLNIIVMFITLKNRNRIEELEEKLNEIEKEKGK